MQGTLTLGLEERTVVGITCSVVITGDLGSETVQAKVDTGASRTSVDTELAARVGLGPITDIVKVRAASANHTATRPLVKARVRVSDHDFDLPVSIADRGDMKYPVIIGMDILTEGAFLIDVTQEEG